ncbi:hypothetical protein ACFHW2_39985, partial [Actinomadura sp. LOL_016]|uniref:hypothetical protein n=1 Tax=Actinomadura sp. LOL_016 TaxID=3345411 RepID=UPI003A8BF8CD
RWRGYREPTDLASNFAGAVHIDERDLFLLRESDPAGFEVQVVGGEPITQGKAAAGRAGSNVA